MGVWLTSSLGREVALRERMSVVVLERVGADLMWLYMRARQNGVKVKEVCMLRISW
jgi:hypothetical protein